MILRETRYGPMIFPPNDLYIGRALENYGEAHYLQVRFLEKLLAPGEVVIDIGANIGIMTIPLAKRVGTDGYVLALEAHSMLCNCLCGNIALNELNQVQAFNRAASDRTGASFYFPKLDFSKPDNFGNTKLAGLLNFKDSNDRSYDNPVAAIAIDDMKISCPKLVKIDVEGMEPSVLYGLQKTIERAKPFLYIEFTNNQKQILDFLDSIDYKWSLHETPLFNPDNFFGKTEDILRHPESGTELVSSDLICWHKSKTLTIEDPYLINVSESDHPRHLKIREIINDNQAANYTVH